MAENNAIKEIPDQDKGNRVDIGEVFKADTSEEAGRLFILARQRLLEVNQWKNYCEGVSATFIHTDKEGEPKEGVPQPGDYFCIDIPGPGTKAGDGYDWVRVELVEDHTAPGAPEEYTIIRVRPSAKPGGVETAHFFDEEATSSFIVRRKDNTVSAEVHGRNEQPNKDNTRTIDKLRNALVGAGAIGGLSNIQWTKLVKGLLKE